MKEIPLTQGKVALVDDEDFEELNQYKWCAKRDFHTYYVHRTPTIGYKHQILISMHRAIMNPPEGYMVDHIDGNGLNNQRSNLRVVTQRQNTQNKHIEKTGKYPGVSWHSIGKKWRARITINGREKHLGLFNTEIEAFRAYYDAVMELGEEVIGFSYPAKEAIK